MSILQEQMSDLNLQAQSGDTPSVDNLPTTSPVPSVPNVLGLTPWIVDKSKYESQFMDADKDHDGLVSRTDVNDLILQSGLSRVYLAHIWALCDVKSTGLFNDEQFALAMHLVEQKLRHNVEPPWELSPEQIPPSFRSISAISMSDVATTSSTAHDLSASLVLLSVGGENATLSLTPAAVGTKEVAYLQRFMDEVSKMFDTRLVSIVSRYKEELRSCVSCYKEDLLSLASSYKEQLVRLASNCETRLQALENKSKEARVCSVWSSSSGSASASGAKVVARRLLHGKKPTASTTQQSGQISVSSFGQMQTEREEGQVTQDSANNVSK